MSKVWQPVEPNATIHTVDAANNECMDTIQVRAAYEDLEDAPRQLMTVREGFDGPEASVYLPDNLRLCRQVDAEGDAAPLDMPDSPGFWAWEEGTQRGVSEVYEGFSNELIVSDEPGGLGAWHFPGRKWWKLQMPWSAQPAAQE